MKATPLILVVLGIILIWTGFNGTLGTLLASVFTPSKVELVE